MARVYEYIIIHIPVDCILEVLEKRRESWSNLKNKDKIVLSTCSKVPPETEIREEQPPFPKPETQNQATIWIPISETNEWAPLSKTYKVAIDLYYQKEEVKLADLY